MSPIHRRPPVRPARHDLVSSACLLALVARELLELVRYVRTEPDLGAPLLAVAWAQDVAICLDDRPEGLLGAYDLDHGLVVLNEHLSVHERAVVLVHELRHVEATARAFRPSLAYAMPDTVGLHLALEADAQAVATLYAWTAAELGDAAAWQALDRLDRHADVARAFERTVVAGGSVWTATQTAFARWYASPERAESYRRNACLAYLDALPPRPSVSRPRTPAPRRGARAPRPGRAGAASTTSNRCP